MKKTVKRKCEICEQRDAVYAMQYIADVVPSLYTLGSHIRGFALTRVCPECGAERKYAAEQMKQFCNVELGQTLVATDASTRG